MTDTVKLRRKHVPFLAKLMRPKCWPLWVRRGAILIFPVALMLWTVLLLSALAVRSFGRLVCALANMWNRKQVEIRPRSNYYGYSYGKSRRRG